jgi:hypothetical protein
MRGGLLLGLLLACMRGGIGISVGEGSSEAVGEEAEQVYEGAGVVE